VQVLSAAVLIRAAHSQLEPTEEALGPACHCCGGASSDLCPCPSDPIRFVTLNNLAFASHLGHIDRAHCFADAVRHEPRGLVSDLDRAVELVGRNALCSTPSNGTPARAY
jgi:hypothetical protein